MEAQLPHWGGSIALRIPRTVLKKVGITDKSRVVLNVTDDNEILIKPLYRHKTLKERLENWQGTYEPEVVDWGEPVGEEIW